MKKDFIVTEINRVILVGKNEYPQPMVSFNNPMKSNELILHLNGKGNVYFNGKTLHTEEGVVRFLPKGDVTEYIVEKTEFGECIDIFFNTDSPISDQAFAVKFNQSEKIKGLFKKIFSLWVAKNDGYYFECLSILYKIFAELQKQDYIPQKQYNVIKPAIEYAEENFIKSKISVSHLAEICGISEAYLKKLFIKKFGVPPLKYIIQLKINYACDLLKSELYSISQVAEICGYNNIYFFSRQFKEYLGISPTEFVQKYKSSK